MVSRTSAIRIGLVFPDLLGTYGDRGNALVVEQRCIRRGIDAEIVDIAAGTPLPDSLDVYLLGGGEDDAQVMASAGLRASRAAIDRALENGAVILAVCAGFQLLGGSYEARDGEVLDGLGLCDLDTRAGDGRCIGELIVSPDASLGLPTLTGFENHGGRTRLGAGLSPLGAVEVGHGNGNRNGGGNGGGDEGLAVDGILATRVVGTYLHGPVLPRNPALADVLLRWVLGEDALTSLEDPVIDALRRERLHEARKTGLSAKRRDWHLARG